MYFLELYPFRICLFKIVFAELSFFRIQRVAGQSWDFLCYDIYIYITIYDALSCEGKKVIMQIHSSALYGAWGVEEWLVSMATLHHACVSRDAIAAARCQRLPARGHNHGWQ